MKLNKILLLWTILLFSLISCQNEVYVEDGNNTNHALSDEEQLQSNDSVEVNQNRDLAEHATNDYYSLIYNHNVLGVLFESKWYDIEDISISDLSTTYSVLSLEGIENKEIKLNFEKSNEGRVYATYEQEPVSDYKSLIAFNGEWALLPRTINIHSNSELYYELVMKNLNEHNLIVEDTDFRLLVYEVDLDGDGINEEIILADNVMKEWSYMENNSFSIIHVRKKVGDKVEEYYIANDMFKNEDKNIDSISIVRNIIGILDVTGDGKMEIIVESSSIDGEGYGIFKISELGVELIHEYYEGY